MAKVIFTIALEHLKLAKRMNIGWDGCEFGAPAVDCKRPYGNSDVYGDIAEILGIRKPDFDNGEDWDNSYLSAMDKIHKEMKTVLQIAVCVGYFAAGDYELDLYHHNWEPVRTGGN